MRKLYMILATGTTLLAACYKPSAYDPQVNNPTLISVVAYKAEIYANGSSTDSIRVEIPENTDPSRRMVVLTTNLGSFVDSNKQSIMIAVNKTDIRFPQKRVEFVALKSGIQNGTASITAALKGNISTSSITFKFDTASVVKVEADKFFIGDYAEANIKATVSAPKSGTGRPSSGQKIFFSAATDSLGKHQKGYFRAVIDKSDDQGNATAVYACDSTYKGEIYIIAKLVKGTRDTAFAKFKIFKTKP